MTSKELTEKLDELIVVALKAGMPTTEAADSLIDAISDLAGAVIVRVNSDMTFEKVVPHTTEMSKQIWKLVQACVLKHGYGKHKAESN